MNELKQNQKLPPDTGQTVSGKSIPRWSAARKREVVLLDRRTALLACTSAGLLCMAGPVASQPAPRVVFLNPGEPVERGTGPYWRMVAQFMAAAAKTFGMQLEMLWAERDHLLMLRQAEEVARRAEAPDYIVIVNEKLAAQQMLKTLERSPAKVFLIHNDLTPEQRREIGNEREQIRNWIGTATTDAARGGYLLMEELYRQLGRRDARVIGITGDRNTPVSLERAQGVEDYIAHAGRGRIHQLVFGDWSYADGEQKAHVLLSRYPDTNIIWASNDSMALGALRAVQARGTSVLVGGMGGWGDALVSVAEGGLAATAAGDYLIGAWAIVLLHDYHHGRDFVAPSGLNQKLDYLYVVNRANVGQFDEVVFKRGDALNFGLYSKLVHPRSGPYEFRLEHLVRNPEVP
jgi:ABC-type sugar transport system substrate-binding protein